MKKIIRLLSMLLLLSLLGAAFVFASDSVDDPGQYHVDHSMDKVISAYKIAITNNIPHLAVSVRLLDSSEIEFQDQGHEINIPENARGTYFGAFSWVLAGNAFQTVNVSFTLGQMSLNGQPTSSKDEYIPYSAKLVYGTSRVGNASIHMNGRTSSLNYIVNNFTNVTYHFYYADAVTGDIGSDLNSAAAKNISTASVSFDVAYNMSTYTKVTNTNGDETYGNARPAKKYIDDYITAVSVRTQDWQGHTTIPAVCDHWNRIGMAYIMPNITSDGKIPDSNPEIKLKTGNYYATVTVEVSIE